MSNYKTYTFADDGIIPNSPLPVIMYPKVTDVDDIASWFENRFKLNNWTNNWRDIILPYDHFHSITHEVLGVSKGHVSLKIGGKNGQIFDLSAGDVLVIPAGVGHFAVSNHSNYEFVGGYPNGSLWDLLTGLPEEKQMIIENLAKVQLPDTDPIFGSLGFLMNIWK